MKKIFRKKLNFPLYLTTISCLLLLLFLTSFKYGIADYRHHPNTNAWKKFHNDNTKNFLKQQLQSLVLKNKKLFIDNKEIKKKLKKDKLDYIELEVSKSDLQKLNQNLPESGKNYIKADMFIDKKEEKVEFKYRGDNFYHWAFPKKSIKIKTKDNNIYNLVNPKEIDFIADKISFDLADKLELYSPKADFIGLFINNDFKGLFIQFEEPDTQFIKTNNLNFTAIFQGENISFSTKSGHGLFLDHNKWKLKGGYSPKESLLPLFNSLKKEPTKISNYLDFDYWSKFYTFVSLIQNCHYDDLHNWMLGLHNNKFYPIVWDPVGWVQEYQSGNGVEDVNSTISKTLRKNIHFNQIFVNNLWQTINDKEITRFVLEDVNQNKNQIKEILNYDFFKGGIFHNPKGTRAIQSSQDILREIENLKQKILKRFNFLKTTLTSAKAKYYLDKKNNYLYLQYNGMAQAKITNYSKIEVFNNSKFSILPTKEIFSGRIDNNQTSKYANTCPTTYRIKINSKSSNLTQPQLIHSLTSKNIKIEKVDYFKSIDCNMDFTPPDDLKNPQPAPIADHMQLKIDFPTINPANYFQTEEKGKEKITINVSGNNYTNVKFKKKKFSSHINLDFTDSKYFGRQKMDLYPLNTQYQHLATAINIATSLQLPKNKLETVNLYANGFYINPYILIEDPKNKSFFETNGLTFNTDIYQFINNNPLSIENWQKISTDPRVKNKNKSTLNQLLETLDNPRKLNQIIDWQNFDNFQTYLQQTGNGFPEYFLYFDNTIGRFKFIPENHVLYKNTDDFTIHDPLISKIIQHQKQGKTIVTNIDSFLKNNKIFTRDKQNNSILIKEGSYEIKKNIIIPANLHVTIQANTTLKLNPEVSILSFSPIKAIATKNKPIKITSNKDKPFGVFAIINTQTDQSDLEFVEVNNGSEAFINNIYISGQFSAYHSNISIKNSYFINAQADDSLNIKHSHVLINNSRFENNSADAIDTDFVTGLIDSNIFKNNGNDSIDISGSNLTISNNQIEKSGDKCISVGEKSNPSIKNNLLDNCNIGIEVKDSSIAQINNNIIKNNNIGINAYQKKDFFSGGKANVFSCTFINNKQNTAYQNTLTKTKLETDNSKITIH